MTRRGFSILLILGILLTTAIAVPMSPAQTRGGGAQGRFDDHQNMMDQLGIKALRPGPNPNNQATFDEATANRYQESMPDVLTMKDGKKVTRAEQWPKRRAEILEDFEREVYGRIPKNVPKVTWEVMATAAAHPATDAKAAPAVAQEGFGGNGNGSGRGFTTAADQPAPRTDANSKIAHAQLLEKARKGRIDVYFEGDSITRRWGATDYPRFLAHWKENFFGWNAADFGWGADTIQNMLWRLEHGELDGVNPKIIVILAGTNNVGRAPARGEGDPRIADVTRGIQALLEICQKKAPEATIVLTAIFPRNDNRGVMPVINRINEKIAQLADGKKVRFLNVNDKLADKDGKLYEGMMNADRLHPDLKGYQVWADGLKPIFTEILGPPAKEDLAPPPTGDPSVAARAGTRAPANTAGRR